MKVIGSAADLFNSLLDLLLPALCLGCGQPFQGDAFICKTCERGMIFTDFQLRETEFRRKFAGDPYICNFFSLFIFTNYSPVQRLIHSIKYEGKYLAARAMGRQIAKHFQGEDKMKNAALVIPVPLHRMKYFERGFNQSEFLSEGICDVLRLELITNAVIRVKNTRTQTTLSIEERKDNVRDAFKVKHPELIRDKRILLVDDVITTGSTINECARVLYEAGAADITAVSLALAE